MTSFELDERAVVVTGPAARVEDDVVVRERVGPAGLFRALVTPVLPVVGGHETAARTALEVR